MRVQPLNVYFSICRSADGANSYTAPPLL